MDPAASFWLKEAIRTLERRDPVDAVHDAEVLLAVFTSHVRRLQGSLVL